MSTQSVSPQGVHSHPLNSRAFLYAALIGGAAIGVLGNLPVFNLINLFLCVWAWVGGALAVYAYHRLAHDEFSLTAMQGAGLGALAGLIGAFVGIFVYALTSMISIPLFAVVANFLHIEGDFAFSSLDAGTVVGSSFVFFMLNAVLYPLFGAISGTIAASLMLKRQPG